MASKNDADDNGRKKKNWDRNASEWLCSNVHETIFAFWVFDALTIIKNSLELIWMK